nr:NAD(+) diphosphatase [Levilactobacillus brevis]
MNNQYNSSRIPQKDDFILVYSSNRVLLMNSNTLPTFEFVDKEWHFHSEDYTYLLAVNDVSFFLVTMPVEEKGEYHFEPVQALRDIQPQWLSFASATAAHLGGWYYTHQFCGVCSKPLVQDVTERALVCRSCGHKIYPEISPAIIVAITNGDKILLTKFLTGYKKYALLSGYVEVGETLEDTIKREVSEEVGLSVHNIKYYSSQPWAFTHSLLMGFTAELAELDKDLAINLETDELSKAQWFERDNIPHDDKTLSLTWNMIEAFRNHEF